MSTRSAVRRVVLAVAVLLLPSLILAPPGRADDGGPKLGLVLNVEGDGILNPLVTRILVNKVLPASLAAGAGIVAGDEIMQIEGQNVVGRHARELQGYLKFNAGETRTLRLKHADGKEFVARLTKPKA